MNILPPAQNPVLIGHDHALRQIEAAFASGRMPHAWLMSGIEGIGKATLAFHAAHYVLSGGQNPLGKLDMLHPAARLVAGEAHPDLFVLRRPLDEKTGKTKDSIPVEDARKLAPFLHMTATHGGWRVAIIDEAHALNRHGQNAILKVIEEPPANCLILLTATAPGALLPTIRSRCRMLPLQPLDETSLRAVLARSGLDMVASDMERLIELSGGSAGFALNMAEAETLPLFEELMALLQGLPALDMAKLHTLADRIGRKGDGDNFSVITHLLTNKLCQGVREKALKGQRGSLDRSLRLWDNVRQTFAMAVDSNLDRKLAFVNAVCEIRRATA
ncbi:MAG: DNA polymerase III subunit delta' [Alphaproteobacteria bacterium]|nr:DNA polymerase III subunit delta' [Alphaproteobacteria bacterium]